MAARMLSGPRLPAARGAATHLVVLCHGYGADGNDLIGLAPHWQRLMPTAAFVAPNAPEPCAAGSRLSMVSHLAARSARDASGRGARAPLRWKHSSMRSSRAPTSAGAPRARGLQPGHDDVAACGPQTQKPGGDRGVFRAARGCTAGALSGCAAGPARAWRRRSDDPARTSLRVLGSRSDVRVLLFSGMCRRTRRMRSTRTGLALGGQFLSLAFRGLLKPKDPQISCVIR